MSIRGKKAERRSGAATLWRLPLIASLGLLVAACGGGGSSGAVPAPTAPPGLWVPNFFGANVVAFDARQRAQSGTPNPALTNKSAAIDSPEEALFDASGNLWITSCSDPVIGAGAIMEFTSDQLKNLKKDPTPNPNVILSDDGSFNIFGCPYGQAFANDGSLWASNRFSADLVNFTPSQLSVGGVQFPNTKIVSSSFGNPEGIQFDAAGTLWVADIEESEIFGFKAATLAAAQGTLADLTPDIINSSASLNGPADVFIDPAGNQWVSNCLGDTVVEFAASDVAASGSPTPVVVLNSTSVSTPPGASFSLDCPEGVVFDKSGNLWVSNAVSDNFGSIVEFTPDQLTASGSPVPNIFLDSDPAGDNLNQPALFSFGPSVK
jgi:sugar lactone lactonase YvrE